MTNNSVSRRDILKLGALAGLSAAAGGLILPGCSPTPYATAPSSLARARTLRLVHFTDSHIQPEREAPRGVALAMSHIRTHAPDAALMIAGGDMIMDSADADHQRAQLQWDLWLHAARDESPLPIEYVCGNHDIWGLNKQASKTTGAEPQWGKKWWLDIVGRDRAYKSMNHGRWTILLLDTVRPLDDKGSYEGRIDEEQFAWLEAQLAAAHAAGRHVLIVGHIPIMCASVVDADGLYIPEAQGGGIAIGKGAVMMDCFRFLRLFDRYPCVRACLSGHIHMTDRIDYRGVTYWCNGAVSGGWWRSPEGNLKRRMQRPRAGDPDLALRPPRAEPGYAIVDLYDDGTIDNRYVEFGWVMVE